MHAPSYTKVRSWPWPLYKEVSFCRFYCHWRHRYFRSIIFCENTETYYIRFISLLCSTFCIMIQRVILVLKLRIMILKGFIGPWSNYFVSSMLYINFTIIFYSYSLWFFLWIWTQIFTLPWHLPAMKLKKAVVNIFQWTPLVTWQKNWH